MHNGADFKKDEDSLNSFQNKRQAVGRSPPLNFDALLAQYRAARQRPMELYARGEIPESSPLYSKIDRACNAEVLSGAGRNGADVVVYSGTQGLGDLDLSGKTAAHLLHEMGHLSLLVDRRSLREESVLTAARKFFGFYLFSNAATPPKSKPEQEWVFYNEQIAVTFAAIAKGLVENTSGRLDTYLRLRRIREDKLSSALLSRECGPNDNVSVYPDYEPYDNFSAYTLCPLARFYETEKGARYAKTTYLQGETVLFRALVQDVQKMAEHFNRHLETMKLFERAADELAKKAGHDQTDVLMRGWWTDLREEVKAATGHDLMSNLYAAEKPEIQTEGEARVYHETLKEQLALAGKVRPKDKVLKQLREGMVKVLRNARKPPSLINRLSGPSQ